MFVPSFSFMKKTKAQTIKEDFLPKRFLELSQEPFDHRDPTPREAVRPAGTKTLPMQRPLEIPLELPLVIPPPPPQPTWFSAGT